MKLLSFVPSSCLFIALSVLPISGADDIFSPSANAKKSSTVSFKTKAEFLSETKDGKIPEALLNDFKRGPIGDAVIELLQREYRVDAKELRRDAGLMCGLLLSNLTKYEIENHEKGTLKSFQYNHEQWSKEVPGPFLKAFDELAIEFAQAVRVSVGAKKEAEDAHAAMLADKQRKIATSDIMAEEEKLKRKAVADAQAASLNAVDEIKASARKKAMEAQAKIRERMLAEMLASDTYKLWEAALQVEQGVQMVANARRILNYDGAVSKESGVTDLAARRRAGEEMVAGKALIEMSFSSYKKLGGRAVTPSEIVAGPDPARELR